MRKTFFKYVIPSMLAFALSGIYSIADGFFVGNAIGDKALAAINIAYPLTAFLQAVGTGIGMGGAVEYSIQTGGGDPKGAKKYFGMSVILLVIAGVGLTFVFLASSPGILKLFGASGQIYGLAREYMFYISLGALFQVLGTGLVPLIRNMGGAVTAMAAMIAGFLTNILLDYLFVWVLPLGMAGAAVATGIGQLMSFIVCAGFFFVRGEKPILRFGAERARMIRRILLIGLSPMGLTFSPNITLILVNRSAASVGGNDAVTCYALISYLSCIVMLLLQGISDGCQPLISLSFGRGDHDGTRKLRNMAYRFSFIVAAIAMSGLYLFRTPAIALFGASDRIVGDVAHVLPIFLIGYLFVSFTRVSTAYFYAADRNLPAYLLIYGEPVILLLLLVLLPAFTGSVLGTWLAVPLSQLTAMFLAIGLIAADSAKNRKHKEDAARV